MDTTEKQILAHLHNLPEGLKTEVLHYVAFISHTYAPAGKEPKRYQRKFGSAAGKYKMAPDFNEPSDDFATYTECNNPPKKLPMKTPAACENMADIRREIDDLDAQIVALLGERYAYVKAASKFKTSEATVKAPERLQAMLGQRRAWAEAAGLSPDVIEKMYRDLVSYFIAEEMREWKEREK